MFEETNDVPSELTPLKQQKRTPPQYQIHFSDADSVYGKRIHNSSCNNGTTVLGSEVNSEHLIINRTTIDRKMDDTKRILLKVGFDFLILCCVGFPILIFFVVGDPFKRGFFCDDESLMHPFHESTITNWMLYIIGIALPIIVIVITEVIRSKMKHTQVQPLKVFNANIPFWVVQAYKSIGMFGFGAAVSQLLTDVGKYTIGRLRPHFFDVCQPMMPDKSTCHDSINQGRYITDFVCNSEKSSKRMLKEMRLSFPSGHSSFSMYTLVFCAIFLQARMNWRGSKLLKHFFQFLLILLAWYTCLSRISDYKHHWSDVLAGGVLGASVAVVVSNFCTNLFTVERKLGLMTLPQTRYELSTNHTGTGNGSQ
ncbi:putative phosphatidate phosphatase [Anopheles cruzii]|uniref:putative phosphatidate phosphatase n=1 Tax=Anopheles cruzii TaxID=68878 RepID=UPI0022EC7809|nr:putative phosphatidate phosphatase [Anopheles cruzii]XP_052862303.1 putative phosphatidate phosphatase [Anopheles cruzii]XP_052862304.1 putative phosphatidate phosphatase [Anopheles cruzii]